MSARDITVSPDLNENAEAEAWLDSLDPDAAAAEDLTDGRPMQYLAVLLGAPVKAARVLCEMGYKAWLSIAEGQQTIVVVRLLTIAHLPKMVDQLKAAEIPFADLRIVEQP